MGARGLTLSYNGPKTEKKQINKRTNSPFHSDAVADILVPARNEYLEEAQSLTDEESKDDSESIPTEKPKKKLTLEERKAATQATIKRMMSGEKIEGELPNPDLRGVYQKSMKDFHKDEKKERNKKERANKKEKDASESKKDKPSKDS